MHTVQDGLEALMSGYLNLSNNSGVSAVGRDYVSAAEKSYYASNDLLKAYDGTLRLCLNGFKPARYRERAVAGL